MNDVKKKSLYSAIALIKCIAFVFTLLHQSIADVSYRHCRTQQKKRSGNFVCFCFHASMLSLETNCWWWNVNLIEFNEFNLKIIASSYLSSPLFCYPKISLPIRLSIHLDFSGKHFSDIKCEFIEYPHIAQTYARNTCYWFVPVIASLLLLQLAGARSYRWSVWIKVIYVPSLKFTVLFYRSAAHEKQLVHQNEWPELYILVDEDKHKKCNFNGKYHVRTVRCVHHHCWRTSLQRFLFRFVYFILCINDNEIFLH